NIKISKAQAYDQNFEGEAILRFKDDLLTANLKKLSIYAGKATGLCEINFKNEVPDINIVASAEGMDLFLVSQRASETKGKISGSFALKGNLQDFVVESKGRSPEASLFGQPVNEITLLLSYKNGDTKLNEFVITSDKGGLKASGETKKDLSFYLEGESRGIKLKGESFLGNFSFKVEYFAGTISGSSLKAALSHPFLSLNVSGEAKISEGYVGDQIISAASGKIEAKEGMIKVNGLTISSGDSKLDVSGSIGLGDPTSLTLKGKEINLSDFKILNKFLPEEVGKIKGIADIDITLYGLLPKGGGFDPAKPLADLNARGRITMRNGVLFGEEVTSLEATASWEGKELQIDRFFFKTEKTEINLNGRINGKGEIDMYVSGNMDMKDIRALTRKYANISGNVYLTSKISGKLPIPDLVMDFAAKDPKYNSISLNSIKGSFSLKEGVLALEGPMTAQKGKDRYIVTGSVGFAEREPPIFNLKFEVKEGSLPTFL
ncbi:MAG: hypothetical protein NT030_05085, partial [Candidatus Saganbacteria bacterium]|nr:hypothetical protein [Candidatus Saganbacteria bacterium]